MICFMFVIVFLSLSDLRKKFLSEENHLDRNDAKSVSLLCNKRLKESVIFFQKLDDSKGQPLLLVVQTSWQRGQMKSHSKAINFFDSTYSGVTVYGYALYTLSVQDSNGRGVPVAFIVMSKENQVLLVTVLSHLKESLKQHGITWKPR